MSGPWTRVTDHAWLDDWHAFLEAVEYEAELRGRGFDVWAALAEALHEWLDEYEGGRPSPELRRVVADDLRVALDRLSALVPAADVPGGFRLAAVAEASVLRWSQRSSARARESDG
jgi:hypothetical protein